MLLHRCTKWCYSLLVIRCVGYSNTLTRTAKVAVFITPSNIHHATANIATSVLPRSLKPLELCMTLQMTHGIIDAASEETAICRSASRPAERAGIARYTQPQACQTNPCHCDWSIASELGPTASCGSIMHQLKRATTDEQRLLLQYASSNPPHHLPPFTVQRRNCRY